MASDDAIRVTEASACPAAVVRTPALASLALWIFGRTDRPDE